MSPPPAPHSSKRHRFPAEIITHGVWRYCRFGLSDRDVKELTEVREVDIYAPRDNVILEWECAWEHWKDAEHYWLSREPKT